jgi:hypothetical protein
MFEGYAECAIQPNAQRAADAARKVEGVIERWRWYLRIE